MEGKRSSTDVKRIAEGWLQAIQKQVKKRDEGWGRDAEAAEKAYACDESLSHGTIPDFNILHSNVETTVPAIFNSMPVPDIRERHAQGDGMARVAADVLERAIGVQIDDAKLDAELEDEGRDAFTAGRGVLRLRFDADEQGDFVTNERVLYEAVSWRDYVEGPATRFDRVPWVAFANRLDKDEVERISSPELIALQDSVQDQQANDEITLWEVWDAQNKCVKFLRADNGHMIKEIDDPLGLKGFFPHLRPVQPIERTGRRDPVVPFRIYRVLAEELDRITKRINRIIDGLKVRGIIVAGAEDISRLADADDNELIPVAGTEGLAQTGGLSKAIEWWPIEVAAQVLRELYAAREQTKQSIYEITGISDIVRGASNSGETATAQQIKTQWGSLRIKKLQKLMERQARDAFVMTAELIGTKFSRETLEKITGMEISPDVMRLISDPRAHYRIDVESDSTVREDLARIKGEMSEFLQGTASYFQVMMPMVEQRPEIAAPVVALYETFARNFNLGRQAEDALQELVQMAKQMAQNPPQNEQMEMAKAEMQAKIQDIQARQQADAQKVQLDIKIKQAELQLKEAELALKRDHLDLEEAKGEMDAAKAIAEIAIEAHQKRPAAIG